MKPIALRFARIVATAAVAATPFLGAACGARRAAIIASLDPALARTALLHDVEALASPEMDGRLAGTEGYDRASRFAADRFAAAGLAPGGEEGYFQRLRVETNRVERCDLAVERDGRPVRDYRLGEDYACRVLTGSAAVVAPVMFLGWGFSLPDLGYDDYAGADVHGKIVLVFKGAPAWTLGSTGWNGADLPRAKARIAAEHGAAGLLLVSPPLPSPTQKPIGSLLDGKGTQDERFPQLHVGAAVADDLLAGSGHTLEDLEAAIETTKQPSPLMLGASVRIDVLARYRKDAPALWRLASKNARALDVPMTEETWGGGGADATPFREAGVPTAYFAATRSYDFLHLPGDRTETLNGPLFEGAARVAWRTVLDVAEGRYSRETLPATPATAGH